MKKLIIKISIIIIPILLVIFIGKKILHKEQKFVEIEVKKGSIRSSFLLSGNVEPRNRLLIKPQIAGRIEKILVKEAEKVKKGQIIAYISSQERAALLDIAKSQGEEVYKKWEEIYKPTPVIAPLDGFIIVRDKEPGQTVTTSDYIVVMADELIIKSYVDETDLKHIKLGKVVNCSLDAYPDIKFLGKIEQIAYESTVINNVTVYEIKIKPLFQQINPHTEKTKEFNKEKIKTTYEVDFKKPKETIYKNIPSILRSGMSVTIEVVAEEKKNVLLLPIDAVKGAEKEKYVLKKETKQILKQPVEVGLSDGKNIEIVYGLNEGDIVLIEKSTKKFQSSSLSSVSRSIRQSPYNPVSAFFRR
ncbi:MAG: efflux RND transporter periplasmic adaptor subunit [Candidatus Anstonellales archaeon]